MSFQFGSSPWFSIGLLTVAIVCFAVTGCEPESKEARPPKSFSAPLEKAPGMANRVPAEGSSQSSGGGGSSNPASPLQKAPGSFKEPMANKGPAGGGGGLTKKGG